MTNKERERRRQLAMDAAMEGKHAVVASIGSKIELSEMELICLVSFAEVGMMSMFAELEGSERQDAEESREHTLDAIRQIFESAPNAGDGLNRLAASTAAILRSEKFSKYMPV